VLHELAAAGGRDYLLLPLQFSDGSLNVMAVATDAARGFTRRDTANFERLSRPLAAVLETAATHRVAQTLLDTYVGHRTGRRILEGKIHRGDVDEIQAAIWYADLRGFTPLTETLPAARLLDLLNAYFELVAAAVTPRGGEILRFMGDAMLIVFAADRQGALGAACGAALDAALDAFARVEIHMAPGADRRVSADEGAGAARRGLGADGSRRRRSGRAVAYRAIRGRALPIRGRAIGQTRRSRPCSRSLRPWPLRTEALSFSMVSPTRDAHFFACAD